MSSMLKKTGGLAFKPKVGRRTGAGPASQSTTRAPTAESLQTTVPTPAAAAPVNLGALPPTSNEQPQTAQSDEQTDVPRAPEAPVTPTQSPNPAEQTPAITEQSTSKLNPSASANSGQDLSSNIPLSGSDTRANEVVRASTTQTVPLSTTSATSKPTHSDEAVRHTLQQPTAISQAPVHALDKDTRLSPTTVAPAASLPSSAVLAASQSSVAPAGALLSPSPLLASGQASTTTAPNQPEVNGAVTAGPTTEPPKKKRQYRRRQQPAEDGATEPGEGEAAPPKLKKPRKRKTPTVAVSQEGEPAPKAARHFRRRQATPDPEDIPEDGRPDHATTKIGDLTRDLGLGKKFKHADLILERQRQARHDAKLRKLEKQKRAMGLLPQGEDQDGSQVGTPAPEIGGDAASGSRGPQGQGIDFDIIDGQIMINQSSLVINQHSVEGDAQLETVEEDEFTHLTTSASYMRPSRAMGTNHWDDDDTEKFYMYLKMFGTDFETISHMFPGKNRRQVKLKFNREEKHRPNRVNAAIMACGEKRVTIDLEHYKANRSGFNDKWITQDNFHAEQEELRLEQEKELEAKRQERRDLGLLEDEPAPSKVDDKENGGEEQEGADDEEIGEELIDDADVGGATEAVVA